MISMHFDIKAIFVVILFMTAPKENACNRRHGHSSSLGLPHVRSASNLDRLSESQLRYLYDNLRDNNKLLPDYGKDKRSHGFEKENEKDIETDDDTHQQSVGIPENINTDQAQSELDNEEGSDQTGSHTQDHIVLQTSHTSADINKQDFEKIFDHAIDNALVHMLDETNKDTFNAHSLPSKIGKISESSDPAKSAKSKPQALKETIHQELYQDMQNTVKEKNDSSNKKDIIGKTKEKNTETASRFIVIVHVDDESGKNQDKNKYNLLVRLTQLCGKHLSMCKVVSRINYPSFMKGNRKEREVNQSKEYSPKKTVLHTKRNSRSMSKHQRFMIVERVDDIRDQNNRMKNLIEKLRMFCGKHISKCKVTSNTNLPTLIEQTKITQIFDEETTPKPTVQTTVSALKIQVSSVTTPKVEIQKNLPTVKLQKVNQETVPQPEEKTNPLIENLQKLPHKTVSKVIEHPNSLVEKSHLERDQEMEKLLLFALRQIKILEKELTQANVKKAKIASKHYCPPCPTVTMATSTAAPPVYNPWSDLPIEIRRYLSHIRSKNKVTKIQTTSPTLPSHWAPVPVVREPQSGHIAHPVNTGNHYLGDKAVWIGIAVGFGTSWLLMLVMFGCYRFLLHYRNERQNEQLQKLCNRQFHDDSQMHITMEKITKNNNGNHYVVSIKNDKNDEDGWSSEEEVFNMSDTRIPATSTPVGTPVKKPPRFKEN